MVFKCFFALSSIRFGRLGLVVAQLATNIERSMNIVYIFLEAYR